MWKLLQKATHFSVPSQWKPLFQRHVHDLHIKTGAHITQADVASDEAL